MKKHKSSVNRRRKHLPKLIEIYGGCFWCGRAMTLGTYLNPDTATIDELHPRSRGGLMVLANQVPAHKRCNEKRGNMIAPHEAFQRHHKMLRMLGMMPRGNESGLNIVILDSNQGATVMVDVNTVHAKDNPPEKQAENLRGKQEARDAAQTKLDNAKVGEAAASGQVSAERKASEAQQGRGPAGLNKGPSDTTARDPHNPPGYPSPGGAIAGGGQPTSPGMGTSPPTRQAPGTDKPEEEVKGPAQRAYDYNPTPENKRAADKERDERAAAKRQGQNASDDLRQAERGIADNQSRPAPDQDRNRRRDSDR